VAAPGIRFAPGRRGYLRPHGRARADLRGDPGGVEALLGRAQGRWGRVRARGRRGLLGARGALDHPRHRLHGPPPRRGGRARRPRRGGHSRRASARGVARQGLGRRRPHRPDLRADRARGRRRPVRAQRHARRARRVDPRHADRGRADGQAAGHARALPRPRAADRDRPLGARADRLARVARAHRGVALRARLLHHRRRARAVGGGAGLGAPPRRARARGPPRERHELSPKRRVLLPP